MYWQLLFLRRRKSAMPKLRLVALWCWDEWIGSIMGWDKEEENKEDWYMIIQLNDFLGAIRKCAWTHGMLWSLYYHVLLHSNYYSFYFEFFSSDQAPNHWFIGWLRFVLIGGKHFNPLDHFQYPESDFKTHSFSISIPYKLIYSCLFISSNPHFSHSHFSLKPVIFPCHKDNSEMASDSHQG